MREYNYQATEATIEALRLLKAPWLAVQSTGHSMVVDTAAPARVRLSVERLAMELFSNPLIEAFANGLPVIASRIGSLTELVPDGLTGLLNQPLLGAPWLCLSSKA